MKKRLITWLLTIDVIVYILIIALFRVEHIYAALLSPILTIMIVNLVSKDFRKTYFGKAL